jgi:hypothetical protein
MYFWKNGFYSDQLHFTTDDNGEHISTIPPDAVPVSDDEYNALLEAQSAGKMIVTGPDGKPMAQDPPPPGPEDRAAGIKAELAALDAEYLTPRTLAGLAAGDEVALARVAAHEEKAVPLRAALAEIMEEK